MLSYTGIALMLAIGLNACANAQVEDRIVSIGESPFSAEADSHGGHGKLVDLVRALDIATHSTSKIVLRPFARSLEETAVGKADIHIPFIQDGNTPAPKGLVYVTEINLGQVPFVIYSSKKNPIGPADLTRSLNLTIETEPGHEPLFPFSISASYCVPCSLDKILVGRTDAMIVPADIVDQLLVKGKYSGIHRALYKYYPVRALVPANRNSAAARQYLINGINSLEKSGELQKIPHNQPYSDWQP